MINNLLNWDYLPGMQDPVLSLAVFDKNIVITNLPTNNHAKQQTTEVSFNITESNSS